MGHVSYCSELKKDVDKNCEKREIECFKKLFPGAYMLSVYREIEDFKKHFSGAEKS